MSAPTPSSDQPANDADRNISIEVTPPPATTRARTFVAGGARDGGRPVSHYFAFSRTFDGNGRRRCAECYQPYDDGEHTEVTTLKPYTSYVCPTGGGLGHSSIWTGAYRPDGRTLRDHLCSCGAEFVEEDAERWQLTFETQTPTSGDEWVPVRVVRPHHAALAQHNGLLELAERGEPIRNVVLQQIGDGR